MTKQEYLAQLRRALNGLPPSDIEERVSFYAEMIDDRVEEGLSEEEAAAAIGTVDENVSQILAEISLTSLVKEKLRPKKSIRAWEIVLLILGSPVWLSILVAVLAVIVSVYAALWAVLAALWCCDAALAVGLLGGLFSGVFFIVLGKVFSGLVIIAAGLMSAGGAILLFFGAWLATQGILKLTKAMAIGIKKAFMGKENEA